MKLFSLKIYNNNSCEGKETSAYIDIQLRKYDKSLRVCLVSPFNHIESYVDPIDYNIKTGIGRSAYLIMVKKFGNDKFYQMIRAKVFVPLKTVSQNFC